MAWKKSGGKFPWLRRGAAQKWQQKFPTWIHMKQYEFSLSGIQWIGCENQPRHPHGILWLPGNAHGRSAAESLWWQRCGSWELIAGAWLWPFFSEAHEQSLVLSSVHIFFPVLEIERALSEQQLDVSFLVISISALTSDHFDGRPLGEVQLWLQAGGLKDLQTQEKHVGSAMFKMYIYINISYHIMCICIYISCVYIYNYIYYVYTHNILFVGYHPHHYRTAPFWTSTRSPACPAPRQWLWPCAWKVRDMSNDHRNQ